MTLPILIDSTMLACWRQCQEKFNAEFIKGFRPPGLSIDLHAGGCLATGLEETYLAYYGGKSLPEALAAAHGIFMSEWGDVAPPEHNPKKKAKNKDNVWSAIEAYFEKWHPENDYVQPLLLSPPSLEFTFAIPLDLPGFPKHPSGDPFVYGGRYDMLGTYSGDPVVKDDKSTSGSIGSTWAEQWDLRSQFIGYTWAARHAGFKVDKVVVRGICFQIKENKFEEAIKLYPEYLVARWLEVVRRNLLSMVKAHDEGYFEPNLADACTQYGHCIFMDRCRSANPDAWNSIYEVRHWNPLQKNPIAVLPHDSLGLAQW